MNVLWLPANSNISLSEIDIGAQLHEDERRHAETLKAKARKLEFLRSRWLIRSALGATTQNAPLARSDDGVITWPAGLLGSITHKDGHVGVSLARSEQVIGLGIDIEDIARLRPAFEERLCNRAESALLNRLCLQSSHTRESWLAVFFSFKEAIFKCHYPLGRQMFYFLDAEITQVDVGARTITAKLLKKVSTLATSGTQTSGCFDWLGQQDQKEQTQLVVTSCWIAALQ